MKLSPPTSLRVRLLMLVVVCTLPAIAVMVYNAFDRYQAAHNAAYGIANVAANAVEARYQDLVSGTRNTLALMAVLPAVQASPAACSQALAKLRANMPLYANLVVASLNGEFRCSAVPFNSQESVLGRKWFQEVLATRRFTGGVVSHGFITHRSLLIFSTPHFDNQDRLIGTLNASISPQALAPPPSETTLARYAEVSVFAPDGTLLMRYPHAHGLDDSNQAHSPLFRALLASPGSSQQLLSGVDHRQRFYVLKHVQTGVPGASLLIASGIDQAAVRETASVPLARDLGLVVGIALLIMLGVWWGTTVLVARRTHLLLKTLRRIGYGDAHARTGMTFGRGELATIGHGIDLMADRLQAQTAARESAERASKISQLLYKDLIEQSAAGICVRHQTGEFVLVNEAMCRMLGYTRDELLKMRLTDVIEPTEERGHLLKPGASIDFDSWMVHKDGHRVPVQVSSVRLPSGDIQSVQQDLSVREQAERELAEERLLIYQALATLPGIFYVVNSEGKLLRWNHGMQEITGYTDEELRQICSVNLMPPERRDLYERILAKLLKGGSTEGEQELYTKAGSRIPYYFTARAFHWRGEACAVGIGVDISARVRVQKELAEQEQLLHETINSMPGLFSLSSAEGRFLMWNRRLEQLSGYSADQIGSLPPLDLIAPEHRARVAQRIREAFHSGAGSINADFLCRDGKRITHHFMARRLDWHGTPTLIGVAVDITEQQQAQQLLQNYLSEVQQLSQRLLNTQEEERRHMAAELHDELGQGLLAIMLSLKALEKQSTPERGAEVAKITDMTGQLSERVRKLSLDLRPSMLDDLGLAATVRWYLREHAALAGLKIKLHMEDSLPRLSPSTELTCFRVLQAALTNTAKHANAARVSVWLRVEDHKVRLTVQDDGCGFDVAAARQRARAGKSFGLLGTEERVRLASGHIEIRSAPGQGTRIEAILPAESSPETANSGNPPAPTQALQTAGT